MLEFYRDCKSRVFYDPRGIYPLLAEIRRGLIRCPQAAGKKDIRSPQKSGKNIEGRLQQSPFEILHEGLNPRVERGKAVTDAALILSKYFSQGAEAERQIKKITGLLDSLYDGAAAGQEEQRLLLISLMASDNPGPGLELLKACGFIRRYWPELAALDEADHSKEFHPEGNVWKHTMETFRYRKNGSCDLRLSLGLLLHDAGKPVAVSKGSKRFDGHAELGEAIARKFLGRLGFEAPLINDVCFLVRYHMITAALPRLPFFRTAQIMSSDLFPVLLELYRCDESSSFKGLDGYYESSMAYQSFLRNKRNPYRSADGKKLNNRQLV